VQARFAVGTDEQALLPALDDLLAQPQVGLVGVELLDGLPEQPDQAVHELQQGRVAQLDRAAGEVVDQQVADLAVADVVPVDQVGHRLLAAGDRGAQGRRCRGGEHAHLVQHRPGPAGAQVPFLAAMVRPWSRHCWAKNRNASGVRSARSIPNTVSAQHTS
jgi:hypothetical protein